LAQGVVKAEGSASGGLGADGHATVEPATGEPANGPIPTDEKPTSPKPSQVASQPNGEEEPGLLEVVLNSQAVPGTTQTDAENRQKPEVEAPAFWQEAERRLRRWHRRIAADWKKFDSLDERVCIRFASASSAGATLSSFLRRCCGNRRQSAT
jgi:hypothetical protein